MTRADALASMTADPVDVLVIGGGITGAGIARDAALRGFRVALVEKPCCEYSTNHDSALCRYTTMSALPTCSKIPTCWCFWMACNVLT